MTVQPGFFDLDGHYAELSDTGDALERLSAVVDFEVFRPELDRALARSDRSKGGRPPMDAVLMQPQARPLRAQKSSPENTLVDLINTFEFGVLLCHSTVLVRRLRKQRDTWLQMGERNSCQCVRR